MGSDFAASNGLKYFECSAVSPSLVVYSVDFILCFYDWRRAIVSYWHKYEVFLLVSHFWGRSMH